MKFLKICVFLTIFFPSGRAQGNNNKKEIYLVIKYAGQMLAGGVNVAKGDEPFDSVYSIGNESDSDGFEAVVVVDGTKRSGGYEKGVDSGNTEDSGLRNETKVEACGIKVSEASGDDREKKFEAVRSHDIQRNPKTSSPDSEKKPKNLPISYIGNKSKHSEPEPFKNGGKLDEAPGIEKKDETYENKNPEAYSSISANGKSKPESKTSGNEDKPEASSIYSAGEKKPDEASFNSASKKEHKLTQAAYGNKEKPETSSTSADGEKDPAASSTFDDEKKPRASSSSNGVHKKKPEQEVCGSQKEPEAASKNEKNYKASDGIKKKHDASKNKKEPSTSATGSSSNDVFKLYMKKLEIDEERLRSPNKMLKLWNVGVLGRIGKNTGLKINGVDLYVMKVVRLLPHGDYNGGFWLSQNDLLYGKYKGQHILIEKHRNIVNLLY